MAIKKWIFDLNIQEKVKIPKMVLVQGDTNGNVFQIHLKQTVDRVKEPLNIENSIVTLTFLKEDESVVVGNANIVDAHNGVIEYTCKGNEHSYPGIVIATVEIYDFTKKIRISSMQFRFTVTEQLDNGDAVVSTSEYYVITELISQIKPIIDSEETRITNENKRIANEDTREQSESIRIENENARQQAESERISNDTIIQQHEKTRITSENSREYAEKQRVLAEQERNSNEQIRNDNAELYTLNENTRKNNEETRQQHESTRQAAETSRQLAEDERQANENVRKSNEQERNTSEQIRQDEEDIRQANESTRQTEENTRAQNETTRVSEENARITNETSRKSNEKDRILAETARANAETERVQNEINRVNAELQRETNEENREKLKSELELLQQQLQVLKEHFESGNFGDMFKNVYDKNQNGIVDDAEKLQGKTLQEIQAENMNKIEQGIKDAHDELVAHKAEMATNAHLAKNIGLQSVNLEANNVEDGMNELKSEVDSKESPSGAQAKANAALNAAKQYTDQEVGEVAQELAAHKADKVKHITAQERNTWNGKQDALPAERIRKITITNVEPTNPNNLEEGEVVLVWE